MRTCTGGARAFSRKEHWWVPVFLRFPSLDSQTCMEASSDVRNLPSQHSVPCPLQPGHLGRATLALERRERALPISVSAAVTKAHCRQLGYGPTLPTSRPTAAATGSQSQPQRKQALLISKPAAGKADHCRQAVHMQRLKQGLLSPLEEGHYSQLGGGLASTPARWHQSQVNHNRFGDQRGLCYREPQDPFYTRTLPSRPREGGDLPNSQKQTK